MNRLLAVLWIYAVVGGFNSLADEYRAGSDIAVRTDFASLSSGNELNVDYIEGSSKKINTFQQRNSTEDNALLEKRWHEFRTHLNETNSVIVPPKGSDSHKSTKSTANRLKRRRNRRKKSRKRFGNVTPVTNLTATATVIEPSNGAIRNEITTKMELERRNDTEFNEFTKLSTSETAERKLTNHNNDDAGDISSSKRNQTEMQMSRKTKGPRGKRRGGKARLRDERTTEKKGRSKVTRDEKRKNSKAKRERRKRLRQERMEQRRRKKQGNQNPGNTTTSTLHQKPAIIARKMDAIIPPSIDYIVEKLPTNDVEVVNETMPDGAIDVSVDTPPGNIMMMVPADSEPETLREIVRSAAVSNEDFSSNRIDNAFEGGDLSCLKDNFQPAPAVRNADVKYLRNDLRGIDNAFLEVEYICHHGYMLNWNDSIGTSSSSSSSKNWTNVHCKNGQWFGILPTCIPVKDLTNFNETCNYPRRCEQICLVRDGSEKCTCHKGFRMKNNRCEDINECIENSSVCEYGCINTVGSFRCKCPKGLRVGDTNRCIDINECLLRNGHGPCQEACINTWASYKCSCESLPGTQLGSDGHSCVDLDECSVNNGGCSHTCLNTMGRAFCLCPEGWILDRDWKTCIDIDECADQRSESSEMRCEFGCINTPGSYSCLVDFGADQPIDDDEPECPDGYYRNSTTEDCQDSNECTDDNGGCYHNCVNTIGSYHCVCREGFIFAEDKYTCVVANSSTDTACPPLFPPKHGYLECSRPIASDIVGGDADGFGGRRRITNRPGSQCVLRCPTGFRINGKFSKQCSTTGSWIGESDGTCIRYPKPKLICPLDIVLETPPNESMAKLRIPRPKTDVNYDRDVTISPEWLRNSEVALEIGVRNISFIARHPVSKLTVSCSFSITVLEGKPPAVIFCPQSQTYTLDQQHDSIKIAWNEPIFTDNVNVTEISRTNSPGNSFGVGSHQIVYVAQDQAGYTTRCVFKLLVNVPYRQTLNHPLPIYHMFYK